MKTKFKTIKHKMLSDTFTPVELYLKLRDRYPQSFLLESSDYKSRENSFSYLCLNPIASFKADEKEVSITYPNGSEDIKVTSEVQVADELHQFIQSFESEHLNYPFKRNGLFGYTSYDAIPLFEDIDFKERSTEEPLLHYFLFRFVLVFNHFNNELYVFEHLLENQHSEMEQLLTNILQRAVSSFPFKLKGEEQTNFTDDDFLDRINQAKKHVFRGDVFQMVLSRKFSQSYTGDDFNVYRALRSVNPSPYLFYFDFGNFKIMGSSPEAQVKIDNHRATINPIAGTFKRTGDQKKDLLLAEELVNDPKENAEHVMLVDLARNDLGKSGSKVSVEKYKFIEYYSHVIHLVSQVGAELQEGYNPLKILGETYPAGTLSGAPKYRAMELIDEMEPQNRGFYGGTVGMIGLDGSLNQAIFIRSFVCRKNTLNYQAGCGIVADSKPESELQEVDNKLGALRAAIQNAKNI